MVQMIAIWGLLLGAHIHRTLQVLVERAVG